MKLKRTVALLLTLAMLLSNVPLTGLADDAVTEPQCTCGTQDENHTAECDIILAATPNLTAGDPTETSTETTAAATETTAASTETTAAEPCATCGKEVCECPTLCETCGKEVCECPTLCATCGKETCECCADCGQFESHAENCPRKPTEPKSYFETLMEQTTWRGLFDAMMADPGAAMALGAEEVLALEAALGKLPAPGENADEAEAQTGVKETIDYLKSELGIADCTCGTTTEAHGVDCPKFVPGEDVVVFSTDPNNPTTVKSGSNVTWGSAGQTTYYTVPADPDITISGYVTVQGHVVLELQDNCVLNVKQGIRVTMSNNASLTINGEAKDQTKMGKLNATGHGLIGLNLNIGTKKYAGGAGIGGHFTTNPNDRANGPITINGGYITATAGGEMAAGIGTTWLALTQSTINSGVSSGWMDGDTPINRMITINGGVVVASGGTHGAGIGGGGNSPIVGVAIENARVIATAGPGDAAGIGGGAGVVFGEFASENPKGGTITIESSYVEAYGGTMEGWLNGTAIGDGFSPNAMDGQPGPNREDISATVKISGDSIVFANAPQSDTDYSFNIIIAALNRENNVSVVFENTKGTVYGDTALNWDLEIPDGYELNIPKDSSLTVPLGMTITNKGEITGEGVLIVDGDMKDKNDNLVVDDGEYQEPDGDDIEDADNVRVVVNVHYMMEDGTQSQDRQHAVVLRTSMFEVDSYGNYYLPHGEYGWYFVKGTLATQHRFYVEDSQGDKQAKTKIILGNDCHFTAGRGIAVAATDAEIESGNYVNSLVIYREWPKAGTKTGILEAHGTHVGKDGAEFDTAGIGGGKWHHYDNPNSGSIEIYGGDIRASGAEAAANIGSGENGNTGKIIIHNAKVTAGDAGTAASIGAGHDGTVTTIDIGNSVVLATSDQIHNGIGDDHDDSGTLTVHDSVIFTDKIGPKATTYRNTLLFLNENASTEPQGYYGNYNGTLKYADDENKTVTLKLPLEIPETATLTIKDGETLDFDPTEFAYFIDVQFVNKGKIYRDYGSTLVETHFTANDIIGTQVYEIIELIDKVDNDDITGTGVETFNNNQVYSLPDLTVIVTSEEKSRLEMKVNPEHSTAFDSTAVQDKENQKTYTMPADPVKLTGEVFARFDLTITKAFAEGVEPNAGEAFLFTIANNEGYSLTVTIQGEGSVTVKDLPFGEYTVTEAADWSWRYTVDTVKGLNNDDKADVDHNSVTFTNKLTENGDKWLDHNSSARNLFSNTSFAGD